MPTQPYQPASPPGRAFAKPYRRATLALLALLQFASPARANMSAQSPGDLVAEPVPSLASAHIVQEDLSIDLRPIADDQPARLLARYRIRNDGTARLLELFFVAPGLSTGQVRHQGRAVPSRPDHRALAELMHRDPDPHVAPLPGLSFEVLLVPGEQTIEVEYLAKPEVFHLDLVDTYAIDYVFAPARRWASFGKLALHVQVPAGWEVLDLPAALATKQGPSDYRGSLTQLPAGTTPHYRATDERHWDLDDLPADTLRFHVAPARAQYVALSAAQCLTLLLAALVPLFGGLRLRRQALALGQRVPLGQRLRSLLLCLVAVAALPLLTLPVDMYLLRHRAPNYGVMFATLAVWAMGALACLFCHAFVGLGPKRAPSPAEP